MIYDNLRKFYELGSTRDYNFRKKSLIKLRDEIIKHRDEINKALYKDLGKSVFEAEMSEVSYSLSEISYLIKNLKNLIKDREVNTSIINFKSRSYIKHEPHGLVLIISPWNYPFHLSIVPLAASIAAGNVTVLKTSSSSPNTSDIIEKIIKNIFPEEYIKVEKGGPGVNEKVMSEKYDFLFFTGGKVAGREVYIKAAENLTPTVLELGGQSPCIVDNCNLKIAANRIIWGKFLNCGQTCVAVDYILIKSELYEQLLTELKRALREFYGEDPINSEDYGKIINEKEYDRLINLLQEENQDIKAIREERKIAPYFIKANWSSPCMKEEIFGPILPIITYDNIDEVIDEINKRDTPLATYVFTNNKKFAKKVTERIAFGGGCVNDTLAHISNHELPFGGNGESGFGRYHGKYSFYTFSREKSILNKSFFPEITLRYPPGKKKVNIVKKLLK